MRTRLQRQQDAEPGIRKLEKVAAVLVAAAVAVTALTSCQPAVSVQSPAVSQSSR